MTDKIYKVCGFSVPEYKGGSIDYVTKIGNTVAVSASQTSFGDVNKFMLELNSAGFKLYNGRKIGDNSFYTLERGINNAYISYYPTVNRAVCVFEDGGYLTPKETKEYLRTKDNTISWTVLDDFGMSYVIGLCDGSFMIIDGGFPFESDADKLMEHLLKLTDGEKPVIAAWLFTHPHIDHYRCFMEFHKKYADKVSYETFILSFPEITEEECRINPIYVTDKETEFILEFEEMLSGIDFVRIRPHTGQKIYVRDAVLTFMHTPDDYAKTPIDCVNSTSLVFTMDISGQRVLWTGDCDFDKTCLAERWGDGLKCDIFQIPHHGFCGGGNIKGYEYANPDICLHPDLTHCFDVIGLRYDYNLHLYRNMNVSALFVAGDSEKVITLPYTPTPKDVSDMKERVEKGLEELRLKKENTP